MRVPVRKCLVRKFCGAALIFSIATIYAAYMPRTDNHDKQLHTLLGYLLDGRLDSRDIYTALGISSSTYYRRIREPDYPNAEELRIVARRFGLSSADLQVRFGLLKPEDVTVVIDSHYARHTSHEAMTPRPIGQN
jgi:hypothetical protein